MKAVWLMILRLTIPVMIAAALLSINLRSFSDDIGVLVQRGGGSEPTGNTSVGVCENSGLPPPAGNPFRGIPVQGVTSWNPAAVTAIYCDPAYLKNFGYQHYGVDFAYACGDPVVNMAMPRGVVERAEIGHAMRGNNVKMCQDGFCATYMHLQDVYVSEGETVGHANLIGTVGTTGNSTGCHLHYEVIDPDGNYFDPAGTMP